MLTAAFTPNNFEFETADDEILANGTLSVHSFLSLRKVVWYDGSREDTE